MFYVDYDVIDALSDRVCSHLAGSVLAALRLMALPDSLHAVDALLDCEPFELLWPDLVMFLASCGDGVAFGKALRMALWKPEYQALELLDAGPWREFVAPGPALEARLRAVGLDARNILSIALERNAMAFARALLDRGVDPTSCDCELDGCGCGEEEEDCRCGECYCNFLDQQSPATQLCRPDALRALLRRGCRPSERALFACGPHSRFGSDPLVSLTGAVVRAGRRDLLEALLEFPDVDLCVWEQRPFGAPSRVGLEEFALGAGAGWAVELLDRRSGWSPMRALWVTAVVLSR